MAGNDPLMMGGACERAREWASLRLDDELSVLEEEILERHLDVCDACRRFEEGMRTSTVRIRTTPLEAAGTARAGSLAHAAWSRRSASGRR